MNHQIKIWVAVSVTVMINIGCVLGEPSLHGEAFEKHIQSIKPYLQYWEKPHFTAQSRRLDARRCGTADTEYARDYVVFDKATLLAAAEPGDSTDSAAYKRVLFRWERCMLEMGYSFLGDCPNTEISRAKPACEMRYRR